MRKSAILATAFVLAALCAGRAAALTVAWTGEADTRNASAPENWTAGRAPAEGDSVLFGGLSSKDCVWDVDVTVADFTVTEEFMGDVKFSSPLRVSGNVNVEGGMIDLQGASLAVGGRLNVKDKGLFEMSEGTLLAGPGGVVVDGGAFFSRGAGKASIKPVKPGLHYPFVVKKGKLEISNPGGTALEGSAGMTVHSGVKVERADFLEVSGVKPGSPAVKAFGRAGRRLKTGTWTFGPGVSQKVSRPGMETEEAELAALEKSANVVAVSSRELSAALPPAAPAEAAGQAEEPQDPPFAGLEEYEAARAKTKYLPYVAAQFNGGQYFFGGEQGSLTGNFNVLASMSIKNEKLGGWTLVPLLSSQYQGTKQVTDLVGGGTLFQERMSHSLGMRGVYQLNEKWKLKPSLGYRWEFLKETRDESWGDGLFDYRRPGFSMEAEYAYADPFTLRMGYDFYHISFVNYRSLESIIQDSQGNSLARELAGDYVLDSSNHSLYGAGTMQGPWRSYLEGALSATFRFFPEQHVVNGQGQLNNSTRHDMTTQLATAWRFPRELSSKWKGVGGLRLSAGYTSSNQNSYDAQRLKYLKDYYDSSTVRVGFDFTFYRKLGRPRPLQLDFSATLGRVDYYGRRAQDASGLYSGSRIYQNEAVVSTGISYPMAPHFVWTARVGYGRQSSNQDFERLYKYNLTTTTYRIGFGYEY